MLLYNCIALMAVLLLFLNYLENFDFCEKIRIIFKEMYLACDFLSDEIDFSSENFESTLI
jgi:hypothetical protein